MQRQTEINPGCSRTKQLSQDYAGEAREDGIKGGGHNEGEKHPARERTLLGLAIHHVKWWGASPGFV